MTTPTKPVNDKPKLRELLQKYHLTVKPTEQVRPK